MSHYRLNMNEVNKKERIVEDTLSLFRNDGQEN
jgi:hypothetical protein